MKALDVNHYTSQRRLTTTEKTLTKTNLCFIVMLFLFLIGFLYMNSFTHPHLDYTFTNYLAPLMANFDTIGNYSDILHKDDGMLTQWFNLEQWLYEMNVYAICIILFLIIKFYLRVDILLKCGKHLHDRTVGLKYESFSSIKLF